jgi:hypothetical protein
MNTTNRFSFSNPALHILVWILVWLMHASVFARFYPFELSLLRGLANMAAMAAIFYLNIPLVDRLLERGRYLTYGFGAVGLILFFAVLRTRVNLLFPMDEAERLLFANNPAFNLRLAAVVTNTGAVLFSTIFRIWRIKEENDRRSLETISRQQEAQLQLLRAQINPHFLFNTLNNIYSLAVMRSEKTAPMVLQLSQLLRYVTYDSQEALIPLKKEIAQIEAFVQLVQMSSETPLDIRFNAHGLIDGAQIEPVLLIPIVENCFKHGDFAERPEAFAQLDLEVSETMAIFTVSNSFNPANEQKDEVGGVGLDNIRRRLALRYGQQAALVAETRGQVFTVCLSLPIARQA